MRAFYLIRWLAETHDVHVLALAESPDEAREADSLRHHCAAVEVFPRSGRASRLRASLAALTGRPLTPAYFHSPELARRVRELARDAPPDAVVACSSSTAQYARLLPGCAKVLDLVDVDSAKWAFLARDAAFPWSLVYRVEAGRLRAYEREQVAAFDRVALTTAHELEKLSAFSPTDRAFVLPAGVDLEALGRVERSEAPVPSLLFTGQMDYAPNVAAVSHFVRRIFPELRRHRPTLELAIVGRRPTPQVEALGDTPGVEVTGEVPEVAPYLGRAWAFVAPMRESVGVPFKILEAMGASVPVVASAAAARCLAPEAEEGRDLLVGHDDRGLVEATEQLLSRSDLRERIGVSGRRCACRSFSWQAVGRRLEQAILEIDPHPRGVEKVAPVREIGVA